MAIPLPIIDSMAGADANPLDGNWKTATAWWGSGLRRVSNQAATQPTPDFFGGSVYTGGQATYPFVRAATLPVLPPSDGTSGSRNSFALEFYEQDPEISAAPDGYDIIIYGFDGAYEVTIWLVEAGVYTAMNGVSAADLQAGDTIAVRYVQNLISVWRVRAGVWTELVNTNAADPGFPQQFLGPFYVVLGGVDATSATPGVLRITDYAGADFTTFQRGYPTAISPEANVVGPPPATSPWSDPTWEERQQTWVLAGSKDNGGVQRSVQYNTNQQGGWRKLLNRFITRPLVAQDISGTFDLCAYVQAVWVDPVLSPSNASDVRFSVRVYVTLGQTSEMRSLIATLDDPTAWPGVGAAAWRSLNAPLALAGSCEDGDSLMVEFGLVVANSPTPVPGYPPPIPPGQNYTSAPFAFFGTTNSSNVNLTDATPGSTVLARAPWMDFSEALIEQGPPAAPGNSTCATAVVVPSLPYHAPRITTTSAPGTQKEVWYTYGPFAASGRVIAHALGSNYLVQLDAARVTGSPACSNLDFEVPVERIERFVGTTQTFGIWDVLAGETWYFRLRSKTPVSTDINARLSGGSLKFSLALAQEPQVDDLILPSGLVSVWREGELVAATAAMFSLFPTAVALDYTERTIDDQNGGTNSNRRALVGTFSPDFVAILDLPTLNVGELATSEIGDPLLTNFSPGVPVRKHPSTLAISSAGMAYLGFFGNGLQFVDGFGASVPSELNTVPSDLSLYGGIRVIDATHGDNQPGAPFTAAVITGPIEVTNPWALSLFEAGGMLYYTSGSLYLPVGGQQIRKLTTGGVASGTFATLPATGTANPGVRNLFVFADGSCLVCNGNTVVRLSAGGSIVGTFTPSIPALARVLMDVKVTADGLYGWAVDLGTCCLWKFLLADMSEIAHYETDLLPGTLTQMALINPTPPEPPPEPGEGCPNTLGVLAVSGLTGCRVTLPTG